MGSPASVTVANLVMEDVEERALSSYHSSPQFWKRYVDDVCTALKIQHIPEFTQHLNFLEPTIQFTVEIDSNCELPFLDTKIHHHEDGGLQQVSTGKLHTQTSICTLIPTILYLTKQQWLKRFSTGQEESAVL